MKTSEIKNLIKLAIEKSEISKSALADSDNPQTVACFNQKNTEIETLRAVFDAINGNPVILKIMAAK